MRFAQEISTTDLVTPPKVLTHPAAAYTNEAVQRGVQGNVIVQAYFDADGNITVLKVVKGLGYGLDENALAALKDWRFSPALSNGLPVSAVAEIEVPFQLPWKWLSGDGVIVNGKWVTGDDVRAVNGKTIVMTKIAGPQGHTIYSISVTK